jgi:hypothetical protein
MVSPDSGRSGTGDRSQAKPDGTTSWNLKLEITAIISRLLIFQARLIQTRLSSTDLLRAIKALAPISPLWINN